MGAKGPVALVAALAVGSLLTGCRLTSVKDEAVTLTGVRNAYVVSGSGERPASDGARLAKGDRVRTGTDGAATLVVRDRRVVLAGATEIAVPDGATVELDRGSLLVDHRRGPGVTVRAGDTTVDQVGTGALRVERSFSVLVATLSAPARVRTATGPRMHLDPLYQVTVAGRALPRDAAPLRLRHDAWEREVVKDLLADDDRLNALAADLDSPSAVLPASFRQVAGARRSDTLLAEAIGRAAGRPNSVSRASQLRAAGGSWAVVATLVGTSALDAGSALADVLKGVPASSPSPSTGPTPVVAGRSPDPITGTRSPSPSPSTSRSGGGGSPKPSSSPTPSPSQSDSLTDTIGKILPTPPIRVLP